MTTRELADRIVAMCRERKFVEVVKAHYAEDVVSRDNCEEPRVGFEAVLADNERWEDDNEVHSFEVPACYVDGDTFVLEMVADFTNKPSGREIHFDEIGVYTVRKGKVVSTRFYYGTSA